ERQRLDLGHHRLEHDVVGAPHQDHEDQEGIGAGESDGPCAGSAIDGELGHHSKLAVAGRRRRARRGKVRSVRLHAVFRRFFLTISASLALAFPAVAQERPRGPLAAELSHFFTARTWRNASWGALVVSLTHGDTLFSWHADSRFLPASNAKLFTTAAALHYLGDD